MPVRLILSQGTTADCTKAIELIQGISAENLVADRGYGSNEAARADSPSNWFNSCAFWQASNKASIP